MRTLRARLLVSMTLLIVVTIGVAGLVSRGITHMQIRSLLGHADEERLRAAASALATHYAAAGTWQNVEPLLAREATASRSRLVLTTTGGAVVAIAPADIPLRDVRIEKDRVIIDTQRGEQRVRIIGHGTVLRVRANGRDAAVLYALPTEGSPAMLSLDRALLWTFVVAAALAMLMTAIVARRITGPIERLTGAVQRMARGERDARVDAGGSDEIAQLGSAFNAMAGALAENEELRRRMVSDVAHELRTPLTNIRCQLEAVQDGLQPATRELIDSLHHDAMMLSGLVDDLQELSLAEAGQLRLAKARIDLGDVVARAAEAQRVRAEAAGIALAVDVAREVAIDADERRIAQVVTNLVANAITHTPQGGTIGVRVTSDGARATIAVRDSGSGIAADDLPHVFDRFFRVDESRSRITGGAGLGLAIVRQLVLAHGGEVRVESTVGSGSTFLVDLPLASSSLLHN